MDKLSGELGFSRLSKVLYGPGTVGRLGSEMAALGARRVLVVTGRTLASSPLLKKVTDPLGDACVGVFSETGQHGAADAIEALASEMRRLEVDGVVSFGGGSANDSVKVAIAAVISGRSVEELATVEFYVITDLSMATRDIAFIAVPTTLSAGEYNPAGGATNAAGEKRGVINPRLQAAVIINDPELSAETSDRLWQSTGIRALDHIVEALYSAHSQSFTDALAVKGLELLLKHLPLSVKSNAAWLEHRGHCLTAATLSNFAMINTRYGVSHAFGHKIGPKWDVPHGVTSCISLPHATRLMAELAPERFEALAGGLGIRFDPATPREAALACASRLAAFIDSMGLPRSLEDVGVPRDELDEVAESIHHEIDFIATVGTPVALSTVREMLHIMHPSPLKL